MTKKFGTVYKKQNKISKKWNKYYPQSFVLSSMLSTRCDLYLKTAHQ